MTDRGASEVFNEGPTVSQHVDSTDTSDFHSSTFKLKRTRSMGLFDNFIVKPTKNDKFVTNDTRTKLNLPPSSNNPIFSDHSSDDDSMSSIDTKVNLIPKHKLKAQQRAAVASAASASPNLSTAPSAVINNLLHDDIELNDVKNAPREHVDYLTHKWDVDEISKSWKYVVERRTGVADSIRLENASWRTWAQTKNNLKTLPANLLNWDNRDNEITWLYGPVLRHDDSMSYTYNSPMLNPTTSSSVEKLNLNENSNSNNNNNNNNNNNCDSDAHLKSILKKKSIYERVISDSSYSKLQNLLNLRESKLKSLSPILEPSTPPNILNAISQRKLLDLQPIKSSLKNSSSISFPQIEDSTRKIHFNPRVVQCMAVDYSDTEVDSSETEFHGDDDLDHDDSMDDDTSSDDDDFIIMNKPINISHKPLINSKNVQTIIQLPATTLNFGSDEIEIKTEFKTNKGLNHYDYNSVYKNDSLNDIEMVDVPESLQIGENEIDDQMDVDSFQTASTYQHLEDQPMSDNDDNNNNSIGTGTGSLKSSSISIGLSGLDLSNHSSPFLSGFVPTSRTPSQNSSSGFLLNSSDSEDDDEDDNEHIYNNGNGDKYNGNTHPTMGNSQRGGFDLNLATSSCLNGSSLADVNKKFISSSAKNVNQLSRMSNFKSGFYSDEESDESEEDEMWFGRKSN